MAIYITINKHYETAESVAYEYSHDGSSWGEFLIFKIDLELQLIRRAENEKDNFYVFRAWSKVRREYTSSGFFPEKTCYAA